MIGAGGKIRDNGLMIKKLYKGLLLKITFFLKSLPIFFANKARVILT